jgi:hypothetical protein
MPVNKLPRPARLPLLIVGWVATCMFCWADLIWRVTETDFGWANFRVSMPASLCVLFFLKSGLHFLVSVVGTDYHILRDVKVIKKTSYLKLHVLKLYRFYFVADLAGTERVLSGLYFGPPNFVISFRHLRPAKIKVITFAMVVFRILPILGYLSALLFIRFLVYSYGNF